MTKLSVAQIYTRWVSPVGGNGATGDVAIYATAIAIAESGGDTAAVSASGDYGLWQINRVHAGEFPNLWPKRLNGYASAKMAVALSGNGQNWGPWCTAWKDPAANCGHYLGPRPQEGSAAAGWITFVRTVLGSHSAAPVQQLAGGQPHPADEEWSHIQRLLGPTADDWYGKLSTALSTLRRYAR